MSGPVDLTPAQIEARDRWQGRWGLPILVAALVPLFVTSPKTHWVEIAVGRSQRSQIRKRGDTGHHPYLCQAGGVVR